MGIFDPIFLSPKLKTAQLKKLSGKYFVYPVQHIKVSFESEDLQMCSFLESIQLHFTNNCQINNY